jgi:hypothetical protein
MCIYNAFVEKGILRSYFMDEKETNIRYNLHEGWWITDLSSFLTNSHSIYTIEALEIQATLVNHGG